MRKIKFNYPVLLIAMSLSLSSCEAIAGIFKAGIWVGVIGVAIIVVVILWLISKASKK